MEASSLHQIMAALIKRTRAPYAMIFLTNISEEIYLRSLCSYLITLSKAISGAIFQKIWFRNSHVINMMLKIVMTPYTVRILQQLDTCIKETIECLIKLSTTVYLINRRQYLTLHN